MIRAIFEGLGIVLVLVVIAGYIVGQIGSNERISQIEQELEQCQKSK